MNEVLAQIERLKVVPAVKIDNAKDAVPLARALLAGGLACAEITFRTDAAEEALRRIAEIPEIFLGAGTVLTTDQVDKAVAAGARFIITPGLNPKVVKHCQRKNVCVIPGVCTPSEIEAALELGLNVLKFFPAGPLGGLKIIKAICGPYNMVRFIPTGGVSPENLLEYLRSPIIFACAGTWIAKADLINAGKFDEITKLTAQAVSLVKSLSE